MAKNEKLSHIRELLWVTLKLALFLLQSKSLCWMSDDMKLEKSSALRVLGQLIFSLFSSVLVKLESKYVSRHWKK